MNDRRDKSGGDVGKEKNDLGGGVILVIVKE